MFIKRTINVYYLIILGSLLSCDNSMIGDTEEELYLDLINNGINYDSIIEKYNNPIIEKDWPDPTIWYDNDTHMYYSFSTTGSGMKTLSKSLNLTTWEDTFTFPLTDSTYELIHKSYKYIWSPQVTHINSQKLLYISIYNNLCSCAICVLKETSHSNIFEYQGILTSYSQTGISDVIDPFVLSDNKGRIWLFFGASDGIYRVELNPDGLSVKEGSVYNHVAGISVNIDKSRNRVFEGAYLYFHEGYWFLFASAGQYNTSNYHLVVGRSTSLDGYFTDRKGNDMSNGYAETILYSDNEDYYYGPGHNGEIVTDILGKTYMFYHCHNKDAIGSSSYIPRYLMLQELLWDEEGWPYFLDSKPQ